MIDKDGIKQRWKLIGSKLNERDRRLSAAAEVRMAGWGGLPVVSKITGLAASTIGRGLKNIDAADEALPPDRQGAVRGWWSTSAR